jgi:hypothetical protein
VVADGGVVTVASPGTVRIDAGECGVVDLCGLAKTLSAVQIALQDE